MRLEYERTRELCLLHTQLHPHSRDGKEAEHFSHGAPSVLSIQRGLSVCKPLTQQLTSTAASVPGELGVGQKGSCCLSV